MLLDEKRNNDALERRKVDFRALFLDEKEISAKLNFELK